MYLTEILFAHKADMLDVEEYLSKIDKSALEVGEIIEYSKYNKNHKFDLEVIDKAEHILKLRTIDR